MKRLLPTFLSLLSFLASSSAVLAQGQKVTENSQGFAPLTAIPALFANILGVVTILAAMAAFLMLIFGGFRYIIAQGDPKAIQAARGTLTWAVVGLVMIIVSWLLLLFLSQFLGLPFLTKFCFGVQSGGQPCYN